MARIDRVSKLVVVDFPKEIGESFVVPLTPLRFHDAPERC